MSRNLNGTIAVHYAMSARSLVGHYRTYITCIAVRFMTIRRYRLELHKSLSTSSPSSISSHSLFVTQGRSRFLHLSPWSACIAARLCFGLATLACLTPTRPAHTAPRFGFQVCKLLGASPERQPFGLCSDASNCRRLSTLTALHPSSASTSSVLAANTVTTAGVQCSLCAGTMYNITTPIATSAFPDHDRGGARRVCVSDPVCAFHPCPSMPEQGVGEHWHC
ncbi:uncharacterized protein C8Q71DRAFT_772755 [Rhodofomes roseus]|uniref:Uncharacterized protein n=1 Tax=Rhodofomes roseus TaxID=34475 RepID=A0ABQ8K957_9APHY|nr:uncharacterized protein C8Q71DRAFT_772755 [Rhodofomes roseus]KAH9833838.1 hypothetical protein C8Q71DRAFT_772755 [Rhodofomes roseus]